MARELGHDLEPLESVRETILACLSRLTVEERALEEVYGSVLAEDLVAQELVPGFDNSAMDGFAVQAADLAGAAADRPLTLAVERSIAAGDGDAARLRAGAAFRIMTGAPMPSGADAVVPHELTQNDARSVTFSKPVKPGQNVRRAGGDMRPGDVPLRAGTVLRGPQLAILAALGAARVRVVRRMRAAILSPGSELVTAGERPGPGQVRNSNAHALRGLLAEAGVEPVDLGIVPDRKDVVLGAIEGAFARGADAVITTGGVSAGDFDFVQAAVREAARPGHVFKVAMRPGKPQVFGLFGGKPLFGLPGNPAASIVSFEVFVRPAIRKMRGERVFLKEPFGVRFPFTYTYRPGRLFLLRARAEPDPAGGYRITRPGEQDSSYLSSLAESNVLVSLPAEGGRIEEGALAQAIWLGKD